MANKIILKKSSVASKVPLATDLDIGEIAVNLADQKLYSKNASGTVVLVGTGTATGTVTSVGMTVPTGLTVSGSPVTTSGTLAVTLTSGYSIPTTASQTNWDTAYTDRNKWDGGSTGLVAATGRTSLGGTTVGQNFFTLANPTAITFPRINADNTVSALDASTFRTAIGAGTGSGTVTGVTATSPVASSGGTAPVISLASGYGDTQNPFASKTANYVLAAPNGTAGAPTFRAIVAADIPTLNQNTTGSSGSCTGNAATATLATKASTLSQSGGSGAGMTFNWSGQSGQPSWLWGSNDGTNIYVWNPSNFNVNYATSAGTITSQANSATITASSGVNASQIVQRDANGYIYANYINHNTSETENPTINSIFCSNGDGWTRKASQSHFISQLGLAQLSAGGVVLENGQTISSNYTMTSGKNGHSAGPITIATGVTVTIPTGSNWVIV